ncbi:MAG: thermonuclease family protein [Bacilli bacterium]|nr:thermonuclease family protein [Bacilli bacterium]
MMKKPLKLLPFLLGLALASCTGTVTPSSSATPSSESSVESSSISTEASKEWVDYAHNGSVKLGLDYKGRNFFTDGVEEVSLYNTIDGDTAHFKNASGEVIKCRFFGIDTPESTGKIQPYGSKASKYTAGKLTAAKESGTIVISSAQSEYGAPNPDSTGSRYVSLIWINTEKKNASLDELYLLNLMIVQDGLSWVKNVGDMPEYVDTFYAAEQQAKDFKLMLHSGEEDDDMPKGDYEIVSLLDLKKAYIEEIAAHKRGETEWKNPFDNKKVRIQGTVNGFANHIIYLADFCFYLDEEGNPIDDSAMEVGVNGEYASINVFAGMSVPPSKFTTLGNYIEVCGIAKDSQFGFQVTSVELPITPYNDNDGRLILKADANTEEHALHIFEYTADQLQTAINEQDYNALNCRIHMTTPVTCTRSYQGDSGDITLYFAKPYSFRVYFVFKFKPYPDTDPSVTWTDETKFVDHVFTVSGVFAFHESSAGNQSMQICPSTTSDLVLEQ